MICQESANVVALELRCVLLIENSESHAVEASQTLLSANPDVAVSGLRDRVNGVLRQPVLSEPDFVAKLRKISPGIECDNGPTAA